MNVLSILMTLGDAMSAEGSASNMPQSIYLVGDHLEIKIRGAKSEKYKLVCNVTKHQCAEGFSSKELDKIELKLIQAIEPKPTPKIQQTVLRKDPT